RDLVLSSANGGKVREGHPRARWSAWRRCSRSREAGTRSGMIAWSRRTRRARRPASSSAHGPRGRFLRVSLSLLPASLACLAFASASYANSATGFEVVQEQRFVGEVAFTSGRLVGKPPATVEYAVVVKDTGETP